MRTIELEVTSREDRARRRLCWRCAFCRANRNENAGRRPKHGRTKARYKDHRRRP